MKMLSVPNLTEPVCVSRVLMTIFVPCQMPVDLQLDADMVVVTVDCLTDLIDPIEYILSTTPRVNNDCALTSC